MTTLGITLLRSPAVYFPSVQKHRQEFIHTALQSCTAPKNNHSLQSTARGAGLHIPMSIRIRKKKNNKKNKNAFLIPQTKQTGEDAHSQLPTHPSQQQQACSGSGVGGCQLSERGCKMRPSQKMRHPTVKWKHPSKKHRFVPRFLSQKKLKEGAAL